MSETITLPVRKVTKIANGNFVVLEHQHHGWQQISKEYPYSTSAQAALGRMTSNAAEAIAA